ncbi:hypothetical protein ACIHFE_10310 [Streptomyces sp. NPDC052396]|uniref:DUF7848 domain-containing protein n=1 Tax=Streptomyces sp. NPDC052396 TaxID=3365689 RepID=UPI0037D5DE0F
MGLLSAHTVIRFADWAIGPDSAPESPAILHMLECTTCDAVSLVAEDFEDVRSWAFLHSGRNPSHTGYRETVHRLWRARLVR